MTLPEKFTTFTPKKSLFRAMAYTQIKTTVVNMPAPARAVNLSPTGCQRRVELLFFKREVVMPTVLRIGPYRFFFFSRETGEPAHIHIEAGDKEAKIWLANISMAMSYGFKAHELNELIALVKQHRETLLEAWHEFFGPQS